MHSVEFPSLPLLMVDDEQHLLVSFDTVLRTSGINNIILCQDSGEVMSVLSRQQVSVMLLDLLMPGLSGEEVLSMVVRDFPDIPIIVVTGVDEVETAVKCIKSGAFDYLVKPVEEGRLVTSVKRAVDFRELQRENISLKTRILSNKLEQPEAFTNIITGNERMYSVFRYAEAIADSPMPLLITGETGVGKELLVEAIHSMSTCKGDLVRVNVGGLDDNMFTDTLFGHRKGAFTGAHQARRGLVERASGGTLFLDEIGNLSPPSQIKLLRLLQDREYYAIGADDPEFTNARIIVATNLEPEKLHQSDTFRKDLYYRLQTHHLHVPPLRERLDDVRILVDHFLEEASQALGRKRPTVPEELVTLLCTYHFPGNIRELQSMVYDAVSKHTSRMLSMDTFKTYISARNLSNESVSEKFEPKTSSCFSEFRNLPTLKGAEESLISEAIKRCKGKQSIAARLLGISRQALNRRLKTKSHHEEAF